MEKIDHWKLFRKINDYSKDNVLRENVIVFDQRNKSDIDIVKGFVINKVNIKISYLYIEQQRS